MNTSVKNSRQKPVDIPNKRKLFNIRLINRKNGHLLFGNKTKEKSWVVSEDKAFSFAQNRVDEALLPIEITPDDIQVHIDKYNKKGEKTDEIYNDQATNLHKRAK